MAGESRRLEAANVTAERVRCNAWFGVSGLFTEAWSAGRVSLLNDNALEASFFARLPKSVERLIRVRKLVALAKDDDE
jgi:hypothetical protein